jgi:hypothetical protein
MSPKGEYPSHLNGDGSLKDEAKERRHWRAFWDEFPGWLRTAVVIALSGSASAIGMKQFGDKDPHAAIVMTEDDFAQVVRKEIAPMKAGFKAFVATQPEKVQLAVLKAWNREEEKQKEGK